MKNIEINNKRFEKLEEEVRETCMDIRIIRRNIHDISKNIDTQNKLFDMVTSLILTNEKLINILSECSSSLNQNNFDELDYLEEFSAEDNEE